MSVDADIDPETDLLGKFVTDLQEDVQISDDAITGTLYYLDGYEDFSDDYDLQEGNFLAVSVSVPGVEDAQISVQFDGEMAEVGDGIVVLRVTDKSSQTITVEASMDREETVTKVFDLSGLTVNAYDEDGSIRTRAGDRVRTRDGDAIKIRA